MLRKILLFSVVGLLISTCAFASDDYIITREKAAVEGRYQQMKTTGVITAPKAVSTSLTIPVDIYKIYITPTAATSGIGIYDDTAFGNLTTTNLPTNCKFELYEATDSQVQCLDFGDDPLRLTSGFLVQLFDAYAVILYRDQD